MADSNAATPLDRALQAVDEFVTRYVTCTDPQAVAITLWAALTHCWERFDIVPYLNLRSVEKQSGKSLLLDILELLVARPWRVVNPSPAVTFRKLARDLPTVLLDEVDGIFKRNRDFEELRMILNAGYRRGSTVARVGGARLQTLEEFDVFGPKALAGIGRLPDTITDRSIVIELKRRAPHERGDRFRRRDVAAAAAPIRDALAAAVTAVPDEGPWYPELPDRAADNWEPLAAIAEAAGGDWPHRAHAAALALSAGFDGDDESLGVRLLSDTQVVFGDRDAMFTASLLAGLHDIDDAPWAELGGKELTGHRLARLLKPYGVHPGTIRQGTRTGKGYKRTSFEDAWSRYVPTEPSHRHNATWAGNSGSAEASHSSELSHGIPNGEGRSDVVTLAPVGEGMDQCHQCGEPAHSVTKGVPWCQPCSVLPFDRPHSQSLRQAADTVRATVAWAGPPDDGGGTSAARPPVNGESDDPVRLILDAFPGSELLDEPDP